MNIEKAYKISDINKALKRSIDENFLFRDITIYGEVSSAKADSKGNFYFDITESNQDKIEKFSIVLFKNYISKNLLNEMKISKNLIGKELIAHGSIKYYSGSVSLVSDSVSIFDSEGEYKKKIAKLELKLEKKGYFDDSKKKSIPLFCLNVGLITAKEAAARNDVYLNAKKRSKYCNIVFCPTQVQGEMAAKNIVKNINELDKLNLDVILLVRGGGSKFDLRVFQDEEIIDAVFNAKTPIVIGIGHQDDSFILDKVADKSCGTPSLAMEYVVKRSDEIDKLFLLQKEALKSLIEKKHSSVKHDLLEYKTELIKSSPSIRFRQILNNIFNLNRDISEAIKNRYIRYKSLLKKHSYDIIGINLINRVNCIRRDVQANENLIKNLINKTYCLKSEKLKDLNYELNVNSPIQKLKNGALLATRNNRYIKDTTDIEVGEELDMYALTEVLRVKVLSRKKNDVLVGDYEKN